MVNLGCGSGLWTQELADARYRVLGIDISEPMINITRRGVPKAAFRVGSLFEADIPPCEANTVICEVLNYLFDPDNSRQRLVGLFRRIYNALAFGGVFAFDVAESGQTRGEPRPGDSPKGKIGWCSSKRRRTRSGER